MNNLRHHTKELAFKADRVILHLKDEDHVRLDLNAHEKLHLKELFKKHKPRFTSEPYFIFTFSALFIFSILFSATNFKAYSKILSANLFAEPVEENIFEEIKPETLEITEQKEVVKQNSGFLPLTIGITPYENRIEIPSLNIYAPIVTPENGLDALKASDFNTLDESIKNSLLKGVVYYPGTAKPGEKGNTFLTGHSSNVFWELSKYNAVFALLPKIQVGADVFIYYNQNEFHYRVTSKKEVKPTDVSILEQGGNHVLSLMTCTPVGTNFRRLVVTAELLN